MGALARHEARHAVPPLRPPDHDLPTLLARIHTCHFCAAEWPLGPRPIAPAAAIARLLITGTVAAFSDYALRFMLLPHPSPRNTGWFRRHAWFEHDVLPLLRGRIGILGEKS